MSLLDFQKRVYVVFTLDLEKVMFFLRNPPVLFLFVGGGINIENITHRFGQTIKRLIIIKQIKQFSNRLAFEESLYFGLRRGPYSDLTVTSLFTEL